MVFRHFYKNGAASNVAAKLSMGSPRHFSESGDVFVDDDLRPSLDAATGERNALGKCSLGFQPLKLSVAIGDALFGL